MDSAMNNQNRAPADSVEEAGEKIVSMWDSEEQPTSEAEESTEELISEVSDTEETVEDTEEVEDTLEETDVEEEPMYRVKINGEELEVNLAELRQGYQRQSDYTRKAQELAEQRKEVEGLSTEKQQLQQEREQYAQALQLMQQQQQSDLDQFKDVDWKSLKEDDPYEYMMKRDEYRDAQDRIRITQEEQQRTYAQQMQDYQSQYAKHLEHEQGILVRELPEWADTDSSIKQDIRNYAIQAGFSDQEVDTLADHRSILILKKAMDFDKLTKKVDPKKKAIKSVPKVQKAGRGKPKSEANVEASKKKRARLKGSGSQDDAASVFFDML